MNLTLRLCQKDLRRLWIPIALFATIVVSKLVLGAALIWRLDALDNLRFDQIGLYVNLETAMEMFIGYAIAAAVVHEDVLVGTNAFWMTKPISGARLLGSKVLTLLLVFAVLPCALTVPWWVACGLSLKDIGLASLGVVAPLLCTVVLSATIAALTPNFSRFIVWTFALFAAFTVLMATRSMRMWSVWGEVTHRSTGARDTAYALTALTLLAGLAAVIVHQYRTRRFWRSCGLLGGVLLVAFAFSPWWRWGLLSRFESTLATPKEAAEVTLEVSKFSLISFPATKSGELRTELAVRGIPPGHVITPILVDATLRWRDLTLTRPRQFSFATRTDGTELPTLLNLPVPAYDPALEKVRARKRAGHVSIRSELLAPADPGAARLTYGLSLLPSLVARVEKDPPGYSADILLQMFKLEVLGEMPTTLGQGLTKGSHHARILRRELLPTGEFQFGVVESHGLSPDKNSWAGSNGFAATDSFVDTSFVLVNRSKQNFVSINSTTAQALRLSGVLITWRLLKAGAPAHLNEATHEYIPDPNWFDHVSIVSVMQRPVAKIRRRLDVAAVNAPVVTPQFEPAASVDEHFDAQ